MVQYADYVAGWLASCIHDFLGELPPRAASMKYALITCIDSNTDLPSLLEKSPELRPLVNEANSLGKGLLLPTARLLKVNALNQLFFGFDEIWFFPQEPDQPKPGSVALVGPARIDQARLDEVGAWMTRQSCSLALGDCEELNFIVIARGLVRYLLGHSLEQPPPAIALVETESWISAG
jgi:hypothetical protein